MGHIAFSVRLWVDARLLTPTSCLHSSRPTCCDLVCCVLLNSLFLWQPPGQCWKEGVSLSRGGRLGGPTPPCDVLEGLGSSRLPLALAGSGVTEDWHAREDACSQPGRCGSKPWKTKLVSWELPQSQRGRSRLLCS